MIISPGSQAPVNDDITCPASTSRLTPLMPLAASLFRKTIVSPIWVGGEIRRPRLVSIVLSESQPRLGVGPGERGVGRPWADGVDPYPRLQQRIRLTGHVAVHRLLAERVAVGSLVRLHPGVCRLVVGRGQEVDQGRHLGLPPEPRDRRDHADGAAPGHETAADELLDDVAMGNEIGLHDAGRAVGHPSGCEHRVDRTGQFGQRIVEMQPGREYRPGRRRSPGIRPDAGRTRRPLPRAIRPSGPPLLPSPWHHQRPGHACRHSETPRCRSPVRSLPTRSRVRCIGPAGNHVTAPTSLSSRIRSMSRPSSPRISSVCSANCGARRMSGGRLSNCTGLATSSRSLPSASTTGRM